MQMNFRSAFNGFNREDVVRYIEYLNSKHTAELNQLNSELDYLRTRQPEPAAQPAPQAVADEDTLAQQAARIRELFDRCKALEQEVESALGEKQALSDRCDELQKELDAANDKNEALAAQVDANQKQQRSYQSRMEEELEAYRRAERTERFARERAENLYRQANGVLADATIKVDDAATEVSQLTDRVIAQLAELQDAVAGSKQALRDAAATMYTIRPTADTP